MIVFRFLFGVVAFPCWLLVEIVDYATLEIATLLWTRDNQKTIVSEDKAA